MQQIYNRTPMPKCDLNKVAKHGCSHLNLLHVFRTPFLKDTSERLLLVIQYDVKLAKSHILLLSYNVDCE